MVQYFDLKRDYCGLECRGFTRPEPNCTLERRRVYVPMIISHNFLEDLAFVRAVGDVGEGRCGQDGCGCGCRCGRGCGGGLGWLGGGWRRRVSGEGVTGEKAKDCEGEMMGTAGGHRNETSIALFFLGWQCWVAFGF